WRDTVLVKGYVVVAPQATLRIEAGTVVRFAGTGDSSDAARLVIQGRIQAIGTAERPIILTSDRPDPARGDWGGISFVSSEKRNMLEHCRIEYAASGIAAAFSTVSLKVVAITHSNIGVLMRDSVVQMTGGTVTDSDNGIEVHDSEFELRDATIAAGKSGIVMNRSAVGISTVKISDNELYGILSEDCRIKISSAEISANGSGVRLKGGEGQILASRFSGNRDTALHLSGSRIKVQRCLFINNNQDALRLEDGRALIWGNAFSENKGFNLYNTGREDIVALQNWWGSSDRSAIVLKIYDAVRDPRIGSVQLFPWLNEKPQLQP
ncbi:MAG: right-handed parallel beta-helix repeat-containing protein, partial [Steroidobacteraceae bacterium]|nr:right-handed parallel beta-helix repeat-containing protein [Deltaproteobacteria bacterium]